jgi:hypothetical protein
MGASSDWVAQGLRIDVCFYVCKDFDLLVRIAGLGQITENFFLTLELRMFQSACRSLP